MAAKEAEKEAPAEGAEAAPVKTGFGLRKIIIFIVLPLLVLGGGGGGAAFFLLGGKDEHKEAEHAPPPPPKQTVFMDLPDILVNLNTGGGKSSYLKLKVALELEDAEAPKKIEVLMPRVVDNFQVYLREMRADDLSGSAGLYRVKEELLVRVTQAVQPVKVADVLFKEMLVQQ